MKEEHWGTYDGRQARQVISAVQYLLDGGVLDEEEQRLAGNIQRRLRSASMGSGQTMVPFTDAEEALLSQVEATLWR